MLSRSAGGLLAVALAMSLPSAFHPAAAAVGPYDEQIHAYDVVLSAAPHVARSVAEPSALAPPTDAGEVDQVSDTPGSSYATNTLGALDDASSAAFRAADNVVVFGFR